MNANRHVVDLDTWDRKTCYRHFQSFANPFMCVTTLVDATGLKENIREESFSITLRMMYCALRAANEIEEFRYRVEEGQVVFYDRLCLNTPIAKADKNFTTVIIPDREDWESFASEAAAIIDAAEKGDGEAFPADTCRWDALLVSITPWLRFTGVQHGFGPNPGEGLPVITLGKLEQGADGRWTLPVAIAVHHGFVDGYHISLFVDRFQELLNLI